MERIKKIISIIFNTEIIGILSTIYGVFSGIRDEFLPLDLAQKLRLGGIFGLLNWYWWVIGGLVLWAASVAWKSTKKTQEKESTESFTATETGGGNALAVKFNLGKIIQGYQQVKRSETFDIMPNIIINKDWISVVIPNPLNKAMECYCLLESLEVNEQTRDDVKDFLTAHTHRVSWSGGDTKGKEEGVKVIDRSDMLNVVTPAHAGLRFEMAKGPRDLGFDKNYGIGRYRVKLDLRYKSIGQDEFQSMALDVNFDCYISDQKTINEHDSPDVLKHGIGPQVFFEGDVRDYLYVKIIR